MSSNCSQKSCIENCCNYYGKCPDTESLDIYSNSCHYQYSNEFDDIYFIVIPTLSFTIFVILCIVACIRRRRRNRAMVPQVIIVQDPNLNNGLLASNDNFQNGNSYQNGHYYHNNGYPQAYNYAYYQNNPIIANNQHQNNNPFVTNQYSNNHPFITNNQPPSYHNQYPNSQQYQRQKGFHYQNQSNPYN